MRFALVVLLGGMVAACHGGGGGDGGAPAPSYQLTATAQAGGSITPAGATASNGAVVTFTVTAASGFAVDSVSGCGGTLSGASYATAAVTANCAITATFKALDFHVDVTGNAVGGLVLDNNGAAPLAIDGDGRFTFASGINVGAQYAVRVAQQPVAQVCSVANGSGVIGAAAIAVQVRCVNRIAASFTLTLRTAVDGSGAFRKFLYVRTPAHLTQYAIRADGGLDAVNAPWNPGMSFPFYFAFSPDGTRVFADDGLGNVAAATIRDSDGAAIPSWTAVFGNYVPALPVLLPTVHPSPDGRLLYRSVSAIVSGGILEDLWVGAISDTGVSATAGAPFPLGNQSGTAFDPSGRYFARLPRVGNNIEVYSVSTSAAPTPQLRSTVARTIPTLSFLGSEAAPGTYLYETNITSESGAATAPSPQVALYTWRPDGSIASLGPAIATHASTGEIVGQACPSGATRTNRALTVAQLAPTASGTRYLLERQFATCVGVSSGNDSRLLGVQSITVANGQAAFARLPLDSLPGWSDLGTGGAPHPTKPWLYLGSKYVQRVYAYSVDPVSGAAQPIAGSPFDAALVPSQGESTTPAMIVDPDGTFLYMANLNAGATHVDTFSINPTTGALSPVASYTP